MGVGEGEGKLSSESFPSPSPIFFPALSYDQEVLHAREDDLRGDGGEKQAGMVFKIHLGHLRLDVLPGCGGSLLSRTIGLSALGLLLRTGVAVILPEAHLCCGYPLLSSGADAQFASNMARNKKALQATIACATKRGFRGVAFMLGVSFDNSLFLGGVHNHSDILRMGCVSSKVP